MAIQEKQEALYATIGKLIRVHRQQLGLTQEQVANLLSMSRASVANIENGRQKLLVHTLFDFATALQVDATELLPQMSVEEIVKNLDKLDEIARNFVTTTIESGQEGAEQSWLSDEEKSTRL